MVSDDSARAEASLGRKLTVNDARMVLATAGYAMLAGISRSLIVAVSAQRAAEIPLPVGPGTRAANPSWPRSHHRAVFTFKVNIPNLSVESPEAAIRPVEPKSAIMLLHFVGAHGSRISTPTGTTKTTPFASEPVGRRPVISVKDTGATPCGTMEKGDNQLAVAQTSGVNVLPGVVPSLVAMGKGSPSRHMEILRKVDVPCGFAMRGIAERRI
mmetsp:Transcript_76623/g.164311  ORF Transcript_76623/g.164311 Transcript_76623/m.164311 type:complete len:213 (+) Transcript_76623:1470-2108(+)